MNTLSSLLNFIGNKILDTQDLIVRKTYEYTVTDTIAAGANKIISSNDFGASVPDGYTMLGFRSVYLTGSGAAKIALQSLRGANGAAQMVSIINVGSSAATGFTIQIMVTYIKNRYYKIIS